MYTHSCELFYVKNSKFYSLFQVSARVTLSKNWKRKFGGSKLMRFNVGAVVKEYVMSHQLGSEVNAVYG